MQDELLPPHGLFAQPVVEAKPLPALEQLGLALRQSGLHREVGLGQEQRLAPVAPDLRRLGLRCGDCRRWARWLEACEQALPVASAWPLPWHEPPASSQPVLAFGLRGFDRLARRLRRGLGGGLGRFRRGLRLGAGRFAGLGLCRRLHCPRRGLRLGSRLDRTLRLGARRRFVVLALRHRSLLSVTSSAQFRGSRGVLATPPLTIQCCRKERARADNARLGRSFRTS